MWRTPEGDRRLAGAEAELVRQALAVMVDHLSDNLQSPAGEDPLWDSGVTTFDELTPHQQLGVIRQVAAHLLCETPDTLELTAVNEAAAYAIFATAAAETECEIELEAALRGVHREAEEGEWSMRSFWRRRVLEAYRETFSDVEHASEQTEALALPTADCTDAAAWAELIEHLADRILWDRDFELAGAMLDADPARSRTVKQLLGIDGDYYTSIADDTGDPASHLRSLQMLVGAP